METVRKKYKDRKTEKKVTVKHYLNKRLKSNLVDSKPAYPLYLQVIVNEITNNFKSLLNVYIPECEFAEFTNQRNIDLANEIVFVEKLVRKYNPSKGNSKFHNVKANFEMLDIAINDCLKNATMLVIAKNDTKTNTVADIKYDAENDRRVYELSWIINSKQVHIIDWSNNNAFNLIDILPVMMPHIKDLQSLKNQISRKLPFLEIYSLVADRYFDSKPRLGHWILGEFQAAIQKEFKNGPYGEDAGEYIRLIDHFLKDYYYNL